ncbi:F11 protein [Finch poxvirus]|uniref:F11 protein n=2 Tax=unclassified Avipoxvirus TaxID=336487 RepID=A0AAT9UQK1_9POXV|nr:F11 protein [Finch poxvirus]UOX39015.1 F11 protein [Finch poxvirus]
MKRNISNKQELADSSSNEVCTAKSPKLDKNDDVTDTNSTLNELYFNFTDTPYYKLVKSDDDKVNINLTYGYNIVKIHNINNLLDDINKLIPSAPSNLSGYYKIPVNSIKIDCLNDVNNYLEVKDIKLVYIVHGNELSDINNYDSNFLGFTAVICINNTGRSMVMVKHCNGKQHSMVTGLCLVARSFYSINILPQIIGSSKYLIVYLTTTKKFNDMWPETLSINKDKDNVSYLQDTKEDNHVTVATNIERNVYKNVEAFILNSILLEDLKSRLNVTKQLNANIDSIFHHNSNILISDILKQSTDAAIQGISNMPLMSNILALELKRSTNTKNRIRDKLIKSAVNSKDVEEILASIPSEEKTLEQLKFNQACIYDHYKKAIEDTNKKMDAGCRSLEHNYTANLYKVYGQNEYMITYILALINRVSSIMETLKHNLLGLDEFTIRNMNCIISQRTKKNRVSNSL